MDAKNYEKYLTPPVRNDRKPLQSLIPLKAPLRVLIDPCDICNFRCEFCFQHYEKKHKGNAMTLETFDRVLSQLKEFGEKINVVHLYGFGEPLLNPDLPQMVAELKKSGVCKEIAITSNGSMLSKKMSDELVKSGLDRLSISPNGLSDEDFARVANAKVSFDKVYDEIKYFYRNREQCHLHVKINGECFSEEERNRFVQLFADCTDSINIDHVVDIWPGLEVTNSSDSANREKQNMYGENYCNKDEDPICPQMFYELVVHSDGTVSPCCADCRYKSENLGNIFETTLREIWLGKQLNAMRKATVYGEKIPYEACNECNYPKVGSTVNLTKYREDLKEKV